MTAIELAEVHKLDIGTVFRLVFTDDGVAVNISSASTKEILFVKPDGTKLTKVAEFSSDGSDGSIWYQTILNDLDQTGVWKVQGHVVTSQGEWHSSIAEFTVHENL